MNDSGDEAGQRRERWVSVTLQHRKVCLDAIGDELTYAGALITNYDHGVKVCETWLPLGVDQSEADDEELIHQLREALLWQARQPPQADVG